MDVTEVKTLIDNLQFLEKALSGAIVNWKKQIKTCDLATSYMSKGILKNICENPSALRNEVFGPLYSFLNTYISHREGKIAFTPGSLDPFLLRGLVAMQKYIVVSDFFARNPSYIVPSVSVSQGIEAASKSANSQKQYKDFIFTVNERLIGCKDTLSFVFLKLLSTVKKMNPEMTELKQYLADQCNSIRIERLKM